MIGIKPPDDWGLKSFLKSTGPDNPFFALNTYQHKWHKHQKIGKQPHTTVDIFICSSAS
jgi:hypothetical protein